MMTEVLNYFEQVFKTAFIDETNDALRMALVQKRPFQEDPTRTAPYLVLTFDEAKGLIPDPDTPPEIGGPTYWKLFLKVKAAPKVQANREEAYRLVSLLAMRVAFVIRQQYLAQPTFANQGRMQLYNWLMIDKVITHVYGGEREWLSYVEVYFFVRVVEPNPYGSYVSSI